VDDLADRLTAALGSRYRVEGELGRGGMATVYLAEDVKHGRPVAIKALRPDLTATLGAERFLREIGIAARLAHPHIVPLIDSGETDGLLWFVSPYVAGGSLRDRLERSGPLPVADVLRIAREAGMGLDYVHRNGFVHRDIKPENILFADEHAVIADFGIARACCGPGAEGVTEIGLTLGTPSYMSPEQAAGETDLQSQSDVYSLASVVYEMLAGEPPFHGDSARAVMARQVTETPKPLRARRPDVPAAVEAAVARALAKDPGERHPSVAAFVAALAGPEPADAHRERSALRCVAVLPFVNASPDPDNEYLSDGITDELITALAKVDGLRVASRTSVFALKGKPQDVRAVGALLGASEVLEGTVRRAGDRLRITAQLTSAEDGQLLWSERYDRRLDDVFAIQDEIARTIVTTLRATSFTELSAPVPRRYTADVRAYGLYLRGRYAWNRRSQEGVAEAIHCFEQAIALDPSYALAYTGLADAWALHVDYRSVLVHEGFAKAKQYARKALELDDTLAEAHASLAWSLFIYDWDFAAAHHEFRRAIALQPTYATAHQWYAFQLVSEGRFDEGLVEAHTAQELDPASISIRRALGFTYYYARRWEQAAYHCRRAIAMNPTAEESYRVLGLVLVEQGKAEESVRVMREAAAMPGSGSYSQAMLGHALARAGRADEARAILADLTALAKTEYVSPMAFATIHASLGDVDPAIDWIERAVEERRGWPAYLRVHPIADPLRSSPRFRGLLERMKLV
jgi:serine/threonine-protein kinase